MSLINFEGKNKGIIMMTTFECSHEDQSNQPSVRVGLFGAGEDQSDGGCLWTETRRSQGLIS